MSLFNTNKTRISYISTETGEKVYPVLVDVKKGVQGGESIQFVSSDINTGMLSVAFMLDNADYNVSGTEVICTIQRPDATILEIPCKHISNNVVEVYLGVNGTSQGGTYTFDFKVYKGGDKVVGTPILSYTVSQSISSDNSIEEDDRLPVLNNLIIQVNNAIESIPSTEEFEERFSSIEEEISSIKENGVVGKGEKGDKGDTGLTPDISIGNVITLEPNQQATVTRRGTNENPIFDFGIPKGEKGDAGGDGGSSGVVGDKLISKFIYNSNKVIQPISLNKETGVFTCSSPHSLSDGEKLVLALNYDGKYNVTWVPYELYLANPFYQYNCLTVTVVSDIEFKIKSYGSSSEMLFTNSKNTNIDVSKFRFESLGANSLSITNLPVQENTSKIKISIIANGYEINEGSKIEGLLNNTAIFSHHFLGKDMGVGFNIVPWIDYFNVGRFQRPFHTRLETLIVVRNDYSFVDGVVFKAGITASIDSNYKASWNSVVKNGRFSDYCTQGRLDGIKFNNSFKLSLSDSRVFMNGTIIEVYEVGGE